MAWSPPISENPSLRSELARVRARHEVVAVNMPRIFSTAGLPDVRRIELWERHNAAALIGLSCHTAASDSLEATELNVQLGQVHLARVVGSSHVVERTAGLGRRDKRRLYGWKNFGIAKQLAEKLRSRIRVSL